MDFSIFVKNIFSRCIGIIGSPKDEWIKINEEKDSIFKVILNFLLPLLLITSIASIMGSYFHLAVAGEGIASYVLIVGGLKPFLSISLSILISFLAINAMIRTYKGTSNANHALMLVVYSFVPVILVEIILGMAPLFYILGLFSLYSFYIFFLGTPILLDIPPERQSNFSTLSATTILVIYLIVNFILSSFFGAIQ